MHCPPPPPLQGRRPCTFPRDNKLTGDKLPGVQCKQTPSCEPASLFCVYTHWDRLLLISPMGATQLDPGLCKKKQKKHLTSKTNNELDWNCKSKPDKWWHTMPKNNVHISRTFWLVCMCTWKKGQINIQNRFHRNMLFIYFFNLKMSLWCDRSSDI